MTRNLYIIITGFLIQLTTMAFGRFAYTLILPDMMQTLKLTNTHMGTLGMGIVTGYLLNSHFSGKLSKTIGEEQTVKASMLLISISLAGLGFFSSFGVLLFLSVLLGAGSAGSYVPLVSILNRHFKHKGGAFGIVMGGAGAGIMLCGYIIPPTLILSEKLGYRTSWYALAAINFVIFIPTLIFLKNSNITEKDPRERIREKTILNALKTNRPLLITVTIYFLVGFSYIIYATYFGAYSINEMGFSTRATGTMWSLFGINSIYSGLLWGMLLDRFQKTRISSFVTSLLALSILIIIPVKSELLFYSSTFLFGFSFMGFIVAMASLISDEVRADEMSGIFGSATLIHGAGQVVGAFLAGYLKDITGTFKIPFSISFIITLLCTFLFMLMKKWHSGASE
ncbi:MAG: YbfB/YjiJ family MFS transporter [Spirochaetota bacterium]